MMKVPSSVAMGRNRLDDGIVLAVELEEEAFVRSYYEDEISQDKLLERKNEMIDCFQGYSSVEYACIHAKLMLDEAEAGINQPLVDELWKDKLRSFTE